MYFEQIFMTTPSMCHHQYDIIGYIWKSEIIDLYLDNTSLHYGLVAVIQLEIEELLKLLGLIA